MNPKTLDFSPLLEFLVGTGAIRFGDRRFQAREPAHAR
jgi:hypothetical protein